MSQVDHNFTSPEEKRDYWPILRLILLAALLLFGGRWVVRHYPVPFFDQTAYVETKQRENDRILSFYADALRSHWEDEGTYPLGLIDLLHPTRVPGGIARGIPPRDAWDHPLRYFSDGQIFLLVSVGRDGKPETEDYHELREADSSHEVCGDPDADLVVSDVGWHQRCTPAKGGTGPSPSAAIG